MTYGGSPTNLHAKWRSNCGYIAKMEKIRLSSESLTSAPVHRLMDALEDPHLRSSLIIAPSTRPSAQAKPCRTSKNHLSHKRRGFARNVKLSSSAESSALARSDGPPKVSSDYIAAFFEKAGATTFIILSWHISLSHDV